jgi:hypothetical protein
MWKGTAEILNSRPDRGGDDRQHHHRVPRRPRRHGRRDIRQLGGAGHAVHQRKAVHQESAGEGAQQQVFHGGLVGALVGAQEAHHDVEGERHQLEANEQRDEVRAGRQEKHAALREQHERVVFAVVLARDFQVLVRHQGHDEGGRHENPIEEDAEAVHRHRALETGELRQAVGRQIGVLAVQPEAGEGFRQRHENHQPLALARVGKNEEVEQQDGAAEQRQHHGRDDGEVVGGGVELAHCALRPGQLPRGRPLPPHRGGHLAPK